MLTVKHRPLTVHDYRELPDTGRRYQLIEGDLHMAPSPNRFHQNIASNLHGPIWAYLQAKPVGKIYLAPFDVYLTDLNVFQPDLSYFSKSRYSSLTDEGANGAALVLHLNVRNVFALHASKKKLRFKGVQGDGGSHESDRLIHLMVPAVHERATAAKGQFCPPARSVIGRNRVIADKRTIHNLPKRAAAHDLTSGFDRAPIDEVVRGNNRNAGASHTSADKVEILQRSHDGFFNQNRLEQLLGSHDLRKMFSVDAAQDQCLDPRILSHLIEAIVGSNTPFGAHLLQLSAIRVSAHSDDFCVWPAAETVIVKRCYEACTDNSNTKFFHEKEK